MTLFLAINITITIILTIVTCFLLFFIYTRKRSFKCYEYNRYVSDIPNDQTDQTDQTTEVDQMILEMVEEMSHVTFDETDKKIKDRIIKEFRKKVKGKSFERYYRVSPHEEGHWLEQQFQISQNAKNGPDHLGYELKKECDKITFGDWSADEYIFKQGHVIPCHNTHRSIPTNLTRQKFLHIFGKSNILKDGRCSWSGKCCPKYNVFNEHGQIMLTDHFNNIFMVYCHEYDEYVHLKPRWVTSQPRIILAYWSFSKIDTHIKNKFNQRGFIICKKHEGVFEKICFGKRIDTKVWFEALKSGEIFFDSGMYDGNDRNYSMWRAQRSFWNSLVIDEYA